MEKEKRTEILHVRFAPSEMKLLKEIQARRQKNKKAYVSLPDVIVDALKFADGQIDSILNPKS